MINEVFNIKSSGIEYSIDFEKFKDMVKYVLKNEYKLETNRINIITNTIYNETILKIDEDYKKNIVNQLKLEIKNNKLEYILKKMVLKKIFKTNLLEENIIYTPGHNPKAKIVKFIVRND